jgi:hypothetical protein
MHVRRIQQRYRLSWCRVSPLAEVCGRRRNKLTRASCSTLAGVPLGASTCTRGECEVFTCDKGYELIGGNCI